MWFKPYVKGFYLVIGHPVNIKFSFFTLTYKAAIRFGSDLLTEPLIMRNHHFFVLCDHYIHFQRGNAQIEGLDHGSDRILWHQTTTATMPLFIKLGQIG